MQRLGHIVETLSLTSPSSIIFACLLVLNNCAWFEKQSPKTKTGAGVGAVVGGIAGLIIDSHNPWRGGILGVAIGAVAGGMIGNIIDHSTREAASKNATVKYSRTTENGAKEEVVATPRGTEKNSKLVSVKYARDGKVMGEEIQKVPLK
jgi:uncharacterized protein YcfJ